MCGRYLITTTTEAIREVAKSMKIQGDLELRPRLDIRPTQSVPIIRQAGDSENFEFAEVRWGFDVEWMKTTLLNAKAESMKGKFWSGATPCLVPASGFYDRPKKEDGKKPAHYRRHVFKVAGQDAFMMAGLWRSWPTKAGELVDCVAIVTTEPNNQVRALPHHRMAAILGSEVYKAWLVSSLLGRVMARQELLACYPSELMTGQGVSEPNGNDPENLQPIGAPLAA